MDEVQRKNNERSSEKIESFEEGGDAAETDDAETVATSSTNVETERTEVVEESAVGQVIVGEDDEYYLVLNVNGPDVDIDKLDSIQILRNDDGTETVLLEIDELSEGRLSSSQTRRQSDVFQIMEIVDVEKHGKIMQQLFGSPDSYDTYQIGKYRRNRVFGTYSCPECEQTFINTARLERHLAVHQLSGSFQCPLCQKVYKYEYNLFYHWRRTCHELSELMSVERRKSMDVNALRSVVMKYAWKKAEEAPPPVMKIGINPNLLFKSDTFNLIDMQAPLSTQSNIVSGAPCKLCGVKLSNSVMQWHLAMHRGVAVVDARTGCGEHFCSLCGQIFRQHYSLIKHWRSGCNEIQTRLPDTRDISMDDDTLKEMVADIMRELVEEYSQRFGGVSQEDDNEVISSENLFLSSYKDKDLSVDAYQQDPVSSRFGESEGLTDLEGNDDREMSIEERHSSSWNYENQVAVDASITNVNEPNPVRTKWSSTHGMVQCSECSRTFVNITRLERHIAGFHATSGAHPCILCGNRFKYDYNLLFHYRRSCPYTKLYIDAEKREQLEALSLRRAVRTLAQKDLQLTSSQKKLIAGKQETASTSRLTPHLPSRPPPQMLIARTDLPNGKSCPVCEVVFYGENAIERHVKAVHPAEYNLYFANETENARMTKQRAEETPGKGGDASNTESDEPPPTLVPEAPIQEPVVSELVTRRVSRIDEDADGNQIFIDENGHVIELGEDEEVQIQFDDLESVQHLFESGQLTMESDEQTIIVQSSDSKYSCNVSYCDSNSVILSNEDEPTNSTDDGKQATSTLVEIRKRRKQNFEGHSRSYDFNIMLSDDTVKTGSRKDAKPRIAKESSSLEHFSTSDAGILSKKGFIRRHDQ